MYDTAENRLLPLNARRELTATRWLCRQACAVEEHFYDFCTADSARAYGIGFCVLACLATCGSVLLFRFGAAPQRGDAWDVVSLLDISWRVQCGHRPHLEYYDWLGVVSFLPTSIGMWLSGNTSDALPFGQAAVAPAMMLWAWWIAGRRFPALAATLAALLVGGLCVGAFILGGRWNDISYAMLYNRYAWSILCVVALLLLARTSRAESAWTVAWEGVSLGVATALLLLSKVNFAVAVVLLLVAGSLIWKREKLFWYSMFAVCAACLACYALFLRGDVLDWWRDVRMLSRVHRNDNMLGRAVIVVLGSWTEILLPAFVVFIHLRRICAGNATVEMSRAWRKALIFGLVLVAIGGLTVMGNSQFAAIPLWALAALTLSEGLRKPVESAGRDGAAGDARPLDEYRLRVCLGYAAAAAAALGFIGKDFGSVAYVAAWNTWRSSAAPRDAHIATVSMQPMRMPPPTFDPEQIEEMRAGTFQPKRPHVNAYEFALYTNDGLNLLRDRVDANSRIFAMEKCNPFPFALGLPPPRFTPVFWDDGMLMDDENHPAAESIFREVTHVMVSKKPSYPLDQPLIDRVCTPYLEAHFAPVAESKMWKLYLLKGGPDKAYPDKAYNAKPATSVLP